MQDTKTYEGELVVRDSRFAIVASRFNDFIVDKLVDGAMDTLRRHGAAANDIDLAWVPGAWELPLVADKLGATGRYDAVIALGAVIRGATAHFEYVSGGVAKGLASAGEKHGLPVIFGVLTVDSIEQAIERAGSKAGNKGGEAAATAIEMVNLLAKLD
ncbi:MAG: 6,7-dimethyl-8-ribityllumazine synthase [Pseudomonadota bacterium]